jgi:anti-anti-sigma factor
MDWIRMLKITEEPVFEAGTILRLEGRIVGPWVAEVKRSCEDALATGRSLALDLTDLEFMDSQGVALLQDLQARGIALLQCPPFAAEQLKQS